MSTMRTAMLLLVSTMCTSAKINLEGLGLTGAQIKAINERMQPQWRQFKEPKEQVCRALALSGGGDRIAYQAGVVTGLLQGGANVQYNVVSGISTGAIFASALRLFPIGAEAQALNFTVGLISSQITGVSSITKQWVPGGIVQGLLFESGLVDSSPLRKIIEGALLANGVSPNGPPPSYGPLTRDITIGATSVNTGKYLTKNFDDPVNEIMAATAVPGNFPFVKTADDVLYDSVRFKIDIFSAVKSCRAKGFADENIVVDYIGVGPTGELPQVDASGYNTVKVNCRTDEIKAYDETNADINNALFAYPKVQFRYGITPKEQLPGDAPTYLSFDPVALAKQVQIGIADGLAAASSNLNNRKCNLNTKVECNHHRDCLNWATANCFPTAVKGYCNDKSMFCSFEL